MMRSLQARLGVGVVVSVLALFSAQWWLVTDSLHSLTESYFSSRLEYDVDSLLAILSFDASGRAELTAEHPNPIFNRPFSGHYYQIIAGSDIIRSRSLWDRELGIKAEPRGSKRIIHLIGPQQQKLIMLVGGFEKDGRAVTIAVAEDDSPVHSQYDRFQLRYVLISLCGVLGLIGLQILLARIGLRPLEQMRKDIRRLKQGKINRLSSNVPAEVEPLVEEINHLIGVLGQRLERSRNALGNLAHALKTPLTVLNQLLNSEDLARLPDLRDHLRVQSEGLNRLIQRELKRARLAGAALPGQRFRPEIELPPLLAMFEQIYREKNVKIEAHIPSGLNSVAEREDMLELFGNLLDNACKWASHSVLLSIKEGPDLLFTVEDDGPGVADDALVQLAERGVRMDESVGGHGLGLAIAKEVVTQYGGEATFGRSPHLGGFMVQVRIPAFRRNSA